MLFTSFTNCYKLHSLRSFFNAFTSFTQKLLHFVQSETCILFARRARSFIQIRPHSYSMIVARKCLLAIARKSVLDLRASALVYHSFSHKIIACGELVHQCCVEASAPQRFTIMATAALLSLGIPSYHTAQGTLTNQQWQLHFSEERVPLRG